MQVSPTQAVLNSPQLKTSNLCFLLHRGKENKSTFERSEKNSDMFLGCLLCSDQVASVQKHWGNAQYTILAYERLLVILCYDVEVRGH